MMRLSNTPPAGAGKVHGVTKTERLLKHIAGLGRDKYGAPIAIRATELAAATEIDKDSISGLLAPHVKNGRLVMCKITVPGTSGGPQCVYRAGPGVPPPDFKPLNIKRNGIALRTSELRPSGAPALSTPKPPPAPIAPPVFLKPQPAVGNTGRLRPETSTLSSGAQAVAAEATPKPEARVRMKKEPAAPKASAGDVRIGINASGALVIALDSDTLELDPKQTRKLGQFMGATQGVWNPF